MSTQTRDGGLHLKRGKCTNILPEIFHFWRSPTIEMKFLAFVNER